MGIGAVGLGGGQRGLGSLLRSLHLCELGGSGGRGNASFKRSTNRSPTRFEEGGAATAARAAAVATGSASGSSPWPERISQAKICTG